VIAFKAGHRKADVMARTWTLPPRLGGRRWRPSGAPRSSNVMEGYLPLQASA